MSDLPHRIESSKDPIRIRRGSNIIIVIFSILGCYLSADFAYRYFHIRYMERAVQTWPAVDATILANSLKKYQTKNGGTWWEPFWGYRYTVNGKVYVSQSDSASDGALMHSYRSEEEGARDRDSRAVGQRVTAYYDPENPEQSVLEKRVTREIDENILFMSIFVFCVSAIIVGVLVYAKNRQLRKL